MLFVSNKFIRTYWTISQFYSLCRVFCHVMAKWIYGQLLAKCYLIELQKHTTVNEYKWAVVFIQVNTFSCHRFINNKWNSKWENYDNAFKCRSRIATVSNCKVHVNFPHIDVFNRMPVKCNHRRVKIHSQRKEITLFLS